MRAVCLGFVLSLLVASGSHSSAEQPHAVMAREELFRQAVVAGGEGLDGVLASDFIYSTLIGSELNSEQLTAQLQSGKVALQALQHSCHKLTVAEAEVAVTALALATVGRQGGEQIVRSQYWHRWQLRAGQWYLLAREVKPIDLAAQQKLCGQ